MVKKSYKFVDSLINCTYRD